MNPVIVHVFFFLRGGYINILVSGCLSCPSEVYNLARTKLYHGRLSSTRTFYLTTVEILRCVRVFWAFCFLCVDRCDLC